MLRERILLTQRDTLLARYAFGDEPRQAPVRSYTCMRLPYAHRIVPKQREMREASEQARKMLMNYYNLARSLQVVNSRCLLLDLLWLVFSFACARSGAALTLSALRISFSIRVLQCSCAARELVCFMP